MEKFLQLVEKHNPATQDDRVMQESVNALYQDWLLWCSKTGRKAKPKGILISEFVTVSRRIQSVALF